MNDRIIQTKKYTVKQVRIDRKLPLGNVSEGFFKQPLKFGPVIMPVAAGKNQATA